MPFFALSKMHSVGRRLFSAPLKMRCVPEKTVFGTEYLFRTVEACFLHQMLPKMRRVPQEAFLSTECQFRTVEGGFWVRRASENASHLVVRSTEKRVAAASERPVHLGAREGAARDKFRVSGTKEMV